MKRINVKKMAGTAFVAGLLLLLVPDAPAQINSRKRPVVEKTGVPENYVKGQETFLNNPLVKMQLIITNANTILINPNAFKTEQFHFLNASSAQGAHAYATEFCNVDLKHIASNTEVIKTNEAYGNVYRQTFDIPVDQSLKYKNFVTEGNGELVVNLFFKPSGYAKYQQKEMFGSFVIALTFADGYKQYLNLQPIQPATAKGTWNAVYPAPLNVVRKVLPGLPSTRPQAPVVK
ncbi:hypothetical protein [Niabella drilacis]|uniref:Uncharacterized protein n=1 Tax=Niabella drilacis (strain DSM 25811 / CCM 8410 / CCUG 62505 / LMG 26954 / E90) TaxID=1285928 RepID=A0A1G6Z315_NIADE|nr:hypothetical protein [Niabella drilacis]SDD96921.1 hypothetical protein SAMN04487894_11734 [Niabella drilacis]